MALTANYVLYWETFSRIWISFLFHVSTSSYKRRAQYITLESEKERFYRYLKTVITSEWKEKKKLSFFIRGVARILTGQRRLTKESTKFYEGPIMGCDWRNFWNLSLNISLKLIILPWFLATWKKTGYSLNPK